MLKNTSDEVTAAIQNEKEKWQQYKSADEAVVKLRREWSTAMDALLTLCATHREEAK